MPHITVYEKVGIPVMLYDQISSGSSGHLKDIPKEFWKPELFMDELDNLLAHLGTSDKLDLLGHSWGGMLAGHYAAARTPNGLKRLVIANASASTGLYEQTTNSSQATSSKYCESARQRKRLDHPSAKRR